MDVCLSALSKLKLQIRGGHNRLCMSESADVKAQIQSFVQTYLAQAGMLSRKKLALDPRLVTTLCRLSLDATPRYSEPLDPGIGGSGVGRSSSGSFTIRIVEPVTSLWENVGGLGKGDRLEPSLAGGGLGNGGMSELPRAFVAVNEDLLTREDSGSHVVRLLLPSEWEPVPSDGTVERCGFQRS